MGLNDQGVVACILNRTGHLGPAPGKRSRGELVLEALDHADATDAATALQNLDPAGYRPFNMIIADNHDAFWLRHAGQGRDINMKLFEIPQGISMLTAAELNDPSVPRIVQYLPRFEKSDPPDPGSGDWTGWQTLISECSKPDDPEPNLAMTVITNSGYGTVSASLLALPAPAAGKPVWLFAPGRPIDTAFDPVPGLV